MITIGQPLTTDTPKSKYKVYVHTMLGDGDAYDYITTLVNTPEDLERLLDALDNVEETCGLFFGDEWPRCSLSGFFHDIDGFSVTYFDEDGLEKSVYRDGKSLSDLLKYHRP